MESDSWLQSCSGTVAHIRLVDIRGFQISSTTNCVYPFLNCVCVCLNIHCVNRTICIGGNFIAAVVLCVKPIRSNNFACWSLSITSGRLALCVMQPCSGAVEQRRLAKVDLWSSRSLKKSILLQRKFHFPRSERIYFSRDYHF